MNKHTAYTALFFAALMLARTTHSMQKLPSLFDAAQQGNLAQVQATLHMGNINSFDNQGLTPLIRAIGGYRCSLQEEEPKDNPVIQYLIDQCADVNLASQSTGPVIGDCPLYFAIMQNNQTAARALLHAKASPNQQTSSQKTLLTLAIKGNSAPTVKQLLDYKASVQEKDNNNLNPICFALQQSSCPGYAMISIIDALIAARANVHAISPEMGTLLGYAIRCLYAPQSRVPEGDALRIIQRLVNAGAQLVYKKSSPRAHADLVQVLFGMSPRIAHRPEALPTPQDPQSIHDNLTQDDDLSGSLTDDEDLSPPSSPGENVAYRAGGDGEDDPWVLVEED